MKLFWAVLLACLLSACGRNENEYFAKTADSREGGPTLPGLPKIPLPGVESPIRLPLSLPLRPYYLGAQASFKQGSSVKYVDVLMSIENSGSMDPYIEGVRENIGRFTEGLTRSGIDFQMGMVKGNNQRDNTFSSSLVGPYPIVRASDESPDERMRQNLDALRKTNNGGDERPVQSLKLALSDPANSSLFRAGATKIFIILSDADDPSDGPTALEYFNYINQNEGGNQWMTIAIGNPENDPCVESEYRYQPIAHELVRLSGGIIGRICSTDYSTVIEKSLQGIRDLLDEFSLRSQIPAGRVVDPQSLRVWVAGVEIPQNPMSGFVWNAQKLSIVFSTPAIPKAAERVEVTFEFKVD